MSVRRCADRSGIRDANGRNCGDSSTHARRGRERARCPLSNWTELDVRLYISVGPPLLPRVVRRVREPPDEIQDRAHVAQSADTWLVDRGVSRRTTAALPHAVQGVSDLRGALFPVGAPGGIQACLIDRVRSIGDGRQTGFGARRRRRSGAGRCSTRASTCASRSVYTIALGAVAIVFAAMLQWLFRRQSHLYGAHLIFALHYVAFMYLLTSAVGASRGVGVSSDVAATVGYALFTPYLIPRLASWRTTRSIRAVNAQAGMTVAQLFSSLSRVASASSTRKTSGRRAG